MSKIYHATEDWTKEKIKNFEKYGTTDVYVLQEGVDFVTDSTGTVITGTVNGNLLDKSGCTIVIPEGIVKISIYNSEDTSERGIIADKVILPSTFERIESDLITINEVVLSEGITSLSTADVIFSGNLYLPKSLVHLELFGFNGNIYFNNEMSTEFEFYFNEGDCTLYGYAGSIAEKLAKENGRFAFVNIGSDYSIAINNSTTTAATIKPNEYYAFAGSEEMPLSSLTVTLDSASTTKLDEFMFSFETPSDISAFSFVVLTDGNVEIKWIKEPKLKPNYIYEVSVVNSVGVIAGTTKEVV